MFLPIICKKRQQKQNFRTALRLSYYYTQQPVGKLQANIYEDEWLLPGCFKFFQELVLVFFLLVIN